MEGGDEEYNENGTFQKKSIYEDGVEISNKFYKDGVEISREEYYKKWILQTKMKIVS